MEVTETETRSAAFKFATVSELLRMVSELVYDFSTLRALSLTNRQFHSVFSQKLGEHIVVRIRNDDDQDAAKHIIEDCLFQGPYLPTLKHLELEVNNGPDFPQKTLDMVERLVESVPNLRKFTWSSEHGDVPISTLHRLGRKCSQLEELHLRGGAELVKLDVGTFPYPEPGPGGARDLSEGHFPRVRKLTCRRVGVFRALAVLHECTQLEEVEMVEMKQMGQSGWLHSDYHKHLKSMVMHEENERRHSKKPLRMELCYSRGGIRDEAVQGEAPDPGSEEEVTGPVVVRCPVCESPDMQRFDEGDPRYTMLWVSWTKGRARQYYTSHGAVRHVSYEFPHPAHWR
ncbi:hypothetical protein F5Y17DRAFT_156016 [Xylariaceae sp. FL0594]|nr:hypothetical protein F5Y17DRAFT_156016 [Xylariaceae sp. FL0594]